MRQAGFTLLETLIYVFIITMFLSTAVVFAYSVIRSDESLIRNIELAENAKFLQQKIAWAITGATQINIPAVGITAATLSLNRPGSPTVIFDVSGGVARMKTGSNAPVALTNGFVTVTSISFSTYAFSDYSKNTVRVKAVLQNDNPAVAATTSLDFFTSIQ